MSRYLRAALTLSLCAAACFKGEATVGTCKADADCGTGSTCNTTVSPHVCVYSCPQKCADTDICVSGQCVAARCIPACDADHQCDTTHSQPQCVNLQDRSEEHTSELQ